MTRFKLMSKVVAAVTGVVAAIALLATAFAQPAAPPHYYYGTDGTPGDTIGLWDADGMVDDATVDANGGWSIQADVDPDDAVFSLNGEVANADKTPAGEGATQVSNLVVPEPEPEAVDCPDEGAMSEDSMGEDSMGEDSMGEDSMGEDSMGEGMAEDCPEDAMGEDAMGEDSMGEDSMGEDGMDEDASLDEDHAYPETGSGGLADNGGVSAGLIGLLIAIGAVAITGLGLRRVRNRA